MPSSDTNLQHLTTKALLLISGAHRPWLTAWHAERIKGKECGKEGQASKILHPQRKISLHVSKQIQISFCPWCNLPTQPSSFRHSCMHSGILKAFSRTKSLLTLSNQLMWISPGRGAEGDKENWARAGYSSEDRSNENFHLCPTPDSEKVYLVHLGKLL